MKMETVLLVEDDVPFRARLAGALLKRGMTVIEAGNPAGINQTAMDDGL